MQHGPAALGCGPYPNCMSDRKYRQRGYQDDDRDRQRPPAVGQSWRIRAGRPERALVLCAAHFVRRRKELRLRPDPRGRALRPLRHARRLANLLTQSAQVRSDLRSCAQCVHLIRRTVRMHAADYRTTRRRMWPTTAPISATDELGARNFVGGRHKPFEPAGRRRRSTTCSSSERRGQPRRGLYNFRMSLLSAQMSRR